jgi:hypothetical protein
MPRRSRRRLRQPVVARRGSIPARSNLSLWVLGIALLHSTRQCFLSLIFQPFEWTDGTDSNGIGMSCRSKREVTRHAQQPNPQITGGLWPP